jgi:hypothetical protein
MSKKFSIKWDGVRGYAGGNNELYITLLHRREGDWLYQAICSESENSQIFCVTGLLENSTGFSLETAQKMTSKVVVLHGQKPAKHEVNGIIANALEALAKQVRESDNDVTRLGSVGGE